MDEMTTASLDTNATHFFQPLDHAKHGRGPGGFRHLPQPGQPGLATLLAALGQRIKELALFGGQPIGQPTMSFSACVVSEVGAEPLKRGGRRDNNAAFAAIPHHQFGQMGEPIVLDRLRQQCAGQFSGKTFAERAESKLFLAFDSVALAASFLGNVCVDRFRKNINLFSNKCQQGYCGPLATAHDASGISQVAAHEGVAEAVVIATAAFDCCQVGI
jgi:hypothetical protein